MSAPAPSHAFYLQPAGGSAACFAVLHPAQGAPQPSAVILCPPFGWEDMCSYRVRREWAEQLARAGHTALRMDLPGSGDSAGGPGDPSQLDSWTQAIDAAARWLGGTQGAQRVAAIGIGLGAVACLRAAAHGAPLQELALWALPASGRALVRELRAFARLEFASALADGEQVPDAASADAAAVVANGYLLSPETVRDLEHLDLTRLELRASQRVLLLGRDGLKVDRSLAQALEGTGATVRVADGPGFGAMTAEPQDARPPLAVFELVSSWLAEGAAHEDAGLSPPAGPSPPAGASPPAGGAPAAREELLLDCGGVAVRERPLELEGPSGRLFGVLAEPLAGRRELTALLLNAGPQRRTGPNRMWVEIARRWAANGVPVLRLDADGIGDADGDAAELGQVTAFYRPRYVEQACAALAALAELGLPERFITLGLCSGAYWGAQAALADERVVSVVMLNPRTLVFDEWRHAKRRTRVLARRALMPATWRKVARGEIKLRKHMETGRTLLQRAAGAPLRARRHMLAPRAGGSPADGEAQPRRAAAHTPIEDLFDALRDRHQRGLLMFTGQEVLRTELTETGVLERMERWPNLELALMGSSADTHTLTPLWLQREVHALVDRVLAQELERLAD